jgi:hypothetical protein
VNLLKGVTFHGSILLVASVLSFWVWTRGEQPTQEVVGDVVVWEGTSKDIQTIVYDSEGRKVRLERRSDGVGNWYVGNVERDVPAGPPARPGPDGAPPKPQTKHESVRFVAVKEAGKLADSLAPLRALRRIGKVDAKRAAEFGFDKPQGTLKVKLGGSDHSLEFGGTAPGAMDRYVRDTVSGEAYAIPGDLASQIMFADSRLLERDVHDWEMKDVTRIRIEKAGKSRDLVPMEDKPGSWADPANPTKIDETAGNWMSKLDRLRVQDYVEKPETPLGPNNRVVHIEYFVKNKSVGYFDVYKVPAAKDDKTADKSEPKDDKPGVDYMAQTEFSRWPFKVLKSGGEQVEQDLGSILK